MTSATTERSHGARTRRVLILAQLDGYANSVKPLAIERFLRERGHDVLLLDTNCLARASDRPGSVGRMLPVRRGRATWPCTPTTSRPRCSPAVGGSDGVICRTTSCWPTTTCAAAS